MTGKVKSLWEDEQERLWNQRYFEIAAERGLHPDDDHNIIDELVFEEFEADEDTTHAST